MKWSKTTPAMGEQDLLQSLKPFFMDLQKIYPRSFCSVNGLTYGLIRIPEGKKLVVMGKKGPVFEDPFEGSCYQQKF
jgi:hypothetical protein